jgi:putative transcriptional regulator
MAPGCRSVYKGVAVALLLAGLSFRATGIQTKSPAYLANASLLVASRDLDDPNFAETVILLVHYDADGVVGLILNKRTQVPVSRAFDGLRAAKSRTDLVYLGGPVDPSAVFALRQSQEKIEGAANVFGDVFLISGRTVLEKTFSSRPDPAGFRVYLGYTGWTNAQLRKEVELGAWFIFRADAAAVFDPDPDTLWRRMIRKTEQKLAGPLRERPVSLARLHL